MLPAPYCRVPPAKEIVPVPSEPATPALRMPPLIAVGPEYVLTLLRMVVPPVMLRSEPPLTPTIVPLTLMPLAPPLRVRTVPFLVSDAAPVDGRARVGGSTRAALARGDLLETAWLHGPIVERGRALGVPTPVNEALIALFADLLSVKRKSVAIVSGHGSRRKRVRILGVSEDRVLALVA